MQGHSNIGLHSFPRQGRWLGRRVALKFPKSTEPVAGEVVRDDVDSPDVLIVKLDDGRLVIKGEWERLEVLEAGQLEPSGKMPEVAAERPDVVGVVVPNYFDTDC